VTEPESLRARREREEVERAVEESPLKGKALATRLRLARETIERYLRAASGPPMYMRRLRRIEDEIARNERDLQEAWESLAAEEPDTFAARWRETAAAWDFGVVNELITKHNEHYPVEANLGMDVRSGDYKLVRGRDYRLEELDADWVLTRFPADITEVPAPPAET
jgi:transcriptional regulator with XRE-family HTH domain